jgi:hypothetical protein
MVKNVDNFWESSMAKHGVGTLDAWLCKKVIKDIFLKAVMMKTVILPITISLLILSVTGCSLIPGGLQSTPTPVPSIPPSNYAPQPGDEQLKRDQVFLDMENSSLLIMESFPIQVSAMLNGSLSDPCHQLRVVVTPVNGDNQINLEVYSVYDPSTACIMVIEPFSATVPLGSYSDGHYRVLVNGELLGEFDA